MLYNRSSARLIGGDLENTVAAYYFTSLAPSKDWDVQDHSGNGLNGALINNARLSTVSGRKCLSLLANADEFQAWNDNISLSLSKEFSIVAWVKIPQQLNSFFIEIFAYNGPLANIANNVAAGAEGGVYVAINPHNMFHGGYVYDDYETAVGIESPGRNVNNNTWQHIGFVVNSASMRLYLNGNRIANQTVSEHESFSGTGSIIFIGEIARGSVDDVGFFKDDLTDTQVRLIYNNGLATIIGIASVDPSDTVAKTWGALKHGQ